MKVKYGFEIFWTLLALWAIGVLFSQHCLYAAGLGLGIFGCGLAIGPGIFNE